jgi:hypothetical protein
MNAYASHIGSYLFAQSWQIALVVGMVGLIVLALRNHSAHLRYLLWLIVLAKCLVPPFLTIPLAVLPEQPARLSGIPIDLAEHHGCGAGTPEGSDWPSTTRFIPYSRHRRWHAATQAELAQSEHRMGSRAIGNSEWGQPGPIAHRWRLERREVGAAALRREDVQCQGPPRCLGSGDCGALEHQANRQYTQWRSRGNSRLLALGSATHRPGE